MVKKSRITNIASIVAIILLAVSFSSCDSRTGKPAAEISAGPVKPGYTNITPKYAKSRLGSEKGIILLDVRTKGEYEEGHIKDSLLIPVDTLKSEAVSKLPNKDAVIFVYCRSGNRSVTASKILVELGYKNVFNLGGIMDWPYEIVK